MSFESDLREIDRQAKQWINDHTIFVEPRVHVDEEGQTWREPPYEYMEARTIGDYGGLDEFGYRLEQLLSESSPKAHRIASARAVLGWYTQCEGAAFPFHYLEVLVRHFLESIARGATPQSALERFFDPNFKKPRRGRPSVAERKALTYEITRRGKLRGEHKKAIRDHLCKKLRLAHPRNLTRDDSAVDAALNAARPTKTEKEIIKAHERFQRMEDSDLMRELDRFSA